MGHYLLSQKKYAIVTDKRAIAIEAKVITDRTLIRGSGVYDERMGSKEVREDKESTEFFFRLS